MQLTKNRVFMVFFYTSPHCDVPERKKSPVKRYIEV